MSKTYSSYSAQWLVQPYQSLYGVSTYSAFLPFMVPPPYGAPAFAVATDYTHYNTSYETNNQPKLHSYTKDNKVKKIWRLVKSNNADINETNQDHETAMHIAIKYQQEEAMQALIYLGIDRGVKNKYGETAIDTLNKYTSMQEKFNSATSSLYLHNVNIITITIKKAINSNKELPYIPNDLIDLIAMYTINIEPWLGSDDNLKEAILLGENDQNHCCTIS